MLCSEVGNFYKFREPIETVKMSGTGVQNRDLGRSHWRGCESWPVTKIWDGDSETNGTNVPEDMRRLDRMCPIDEKREKKEVGTMMLLNSQMLGCQDFQNSVISV